MTTPNEWWQADSVYDELAGTTDETGVPYPPGTASPLTSPSKGVWIRRLIQRLIAAIGPANEGRVCQEASLTVGVYPIQYRLGGTVKTFAGNSGTVLTDDATNYLYLNASNTLTVSTTGFPADATTHLPLAEVVCENGSISSIIDRRGRVIYAVSVDTTHNAVQIQGVPVSSEAPTSGQVLKYDASGDEWVPASDVYGLSLGFTVGSPDTDGGRSVTVQVQDAAGSAVSGRFLLSAWLADSAYGPETGSPPDGGASWGGGTVLAEETEDARWRVITASDGSARLDIDESGEGTWYLCAEVDGRIYASDAINFSEGS